MNVSAKSILFLALMLLFQGISALPQTKKDLEKRKDKLQKEIDFTNKQLQVVAKNKSATQEQLQTLRKKIQLREALIGTINQEIRSLGGEIENTNQEIRSLENDLQMLRGAYAEMIRYASRNRSQYQKLMFVFASHDFNQAYRRIKYIRQISSYRRDQAQQIAGTQEALGEKKVVLEQRKNEKTSLRNTEQKQKSTLENERKDQDQLMKNLTAREQKLRKDLAEKQAAKKKLDRAIEALIRKEIEAARKKAVAAGNKNVSNTNVFNLTPESQKLSSNFAGNRGKLPWPVESGKIISTFGEHPHKELKGIMIKNNGVDIQSGPGSSARSIFEGTVSGVISLPGNNQAVIIRHGEYLTVYSNLSEVFVKTGDKVTTRQRIGKLGPSDEGGRTEIHLEIWKNTSKMDPIGWIARG